MLRMQEMGVGPSAAKGRRVIGAHRLAETEGRVVGEEAIHHRQGRPERDALAAAAARCLGGRRGGCRSTTGRCCWEPPPCSVGGMALLLLLMIRLLLLLLVMPIEGNCGPVVSNGTVCASLHGG